MNKKSGGKSLALILAWSAVCMGMALPAGCKKGDDSAAGAGESASDAVGAQAGKGGSGVAVEVDGAKLTESEVDEKIAQALAWQGGRQMPQEALQDAKSRLREQVIQFFVAETVLVNEAEREKISVEDSELNKVIEDVKKQLPVGAKFEEVLSSYKLTEERYRRNLRRDMQIRKLLESHVKMAPEVTDAEIDAFYNKELPRFAVPEQVHARHILVKCERSDAEAVRAEKKAAAEECRKKLIAGADFAAMAKEKSDCPSKDNGGDIGTFGRESNIAREFKEAAFAQQTNEVGTVVETEFGYHIIQVLEHAVARTNALAEVKDQIAAQLGEEKRKRIVGEYVKSLKSKAKIKYADKG